MNHFYHHIELLLSEQTQVIVPEFGAFVIHQTSATIEGDRIVPPHAIVLFDEKQKEDNGQFVLAYAKARNLKYPEAAKQVRHIVKDLQETLQTERRLTFGRLGVFTLLNNNLLFLPSDGSFLPDNFGLRPLPLTKRMAKREHETVTFTFRRETIRRVAVCLIGLALLAIAPETRQGDYTQYARLNPVDWATELLEIRRAEREKASVIFTDLSLSECAEEKTANNL